MNDVRERFERVCDALVEAMLDDPCLATLKPTVPVDGMGAGSVNARFAVAKILRAALKTRLVYAREDAAEFIGRIGNTETTQPPDLGNGEMK